MDKFGIRIEVKKEKLSRHVGIRQRKRAFNFLVLLMLSIWDISPSLSNPLHSKSDEADVQISIDPEDMLLRSVEKPNTELRYELTRQLRSQFISYLQLANKNIQKDNFEFIEQISMTTTVPEHPAISEDLLIERGRLLKLDIYSPFDQKTCDPTTYLSGSQVRETAQLQLKGENVVRPKRFSYYLAKLGLITQQKSWFFDYVGDQVVLSKYLSVAVPSDSQITFFSNYPLNRINFVVDINGKEEILEHYKPKIWAESGRYIHLLKWNQKKLKSNQQIRLKSLHIYPEMDSFEDLQEPIVEMTFGEKPLRLVQKDHRPTSSNNSFFKHTFIYQMTDPFIDDTNRDYDFYLKGCHATDVKGSIGEIITNNAPVISNKLFDFASEFYDLASEHSAIKLVISDEVSFHGLNWRHGISQRNKNLNDPAKKIQRFSHKTKPVQIAVELERKSFPWSRNRLSIEPNNLTETTIDWQIPPNTPRNIYLLLAGSGLESFCTSFNTLISTRHKSGKEIRKDIEGAKPFGNDHYVINIALERDVSLASLKMTLKPLRQHREGSIQSTFPSEKCPEINILRASLVSLLPIQKQDKSTTKHDYIKLINLFEPEATQRTSTDAENLNNYPKFIFVSDEHIYEPELILSAADLDHTVPAFRYGLLNNTDVNIFSKYLVAIDSRINKHQAPIKEPLRLNSPSTWLLVIVILIGIMTVKHLQSRCLQVSALLPFIRRETSKTLDKLNPLVGSIILVLLLGGTVAVYGIQPLKYWSLKITLAEVLILGAYILGITILRLCLKFSMNQAMTKSTFTENFNDMSKTSQYFCIAIMLTLMLALSVFLNVPTADVILGPAIFICILLGIFNLLRSAIEGAVEW